MTALKGVPDGMPRMPDWEPKTTIAMMDRQGIVTAMLSVSSPGVHFGNDDAARSLARTVNEFAARNAQIIAAVSAPSRASHCPTLTRRWRRSVTHSTYLEWTAS